jgi:hypothetical protein
MSTLVLRVDRLIVYITCVLLMAPTPISNNVAHFNYFVFLLVIKPTKDYSILNQYSILGVKSAN